MSYPLTIDAISSILDPSVPRFARSFATFEKRLPPCPIFASRELGTLTVGRRLRISCQGGQNAT